jgi:glutamate dehydrogenase/leucine dehydrogenase
MESVIVETQMGGGQKGTVIIIRDPSQKSKAFLRKFRRLFLSS